jgi:hypothetical protein
MLGSSCVAAKWHLLRVELCEISQGVYIKKKLFPISYLFNICTMSEEARKESYWDLIQKSLM